ncbi:transposase [Paraburkholderia bannensis]|uniref:transposase n=1 Tax=Paraburkholderia bannensis TaxID=765414 RepID=UPI002ABD5880|nr:transposase [Paraburkholderia bannensis]
MNLDEVRCQLSTFEREVAVVAEEMGDHKPSEIIYTEVLREIVRSQAFGACHKFSAVLYLLLAEFEAQLPADAAQEVCLRIGVVASLHGYRFDHSWVQYGPGIYDPTVCLPDKNKGGKTDGPVFASHDLLTGKFVHQLYTALADQSLGKIAQHVSDMSLEEYSEEIAEDGVPSLWKITENIGAQIGLQLNAEVLRAKHGAVRRMPAEVA